MDTDSVCVNYEHVYKSPKEMQEELKNYVQKKLFFFLL